MDASKASATCCLLVVVAAGRSQYFDGARCGSAKSGTTGYIGSGRQRRARLVLVKRHFLLLSTCSIQWIERPREENLRLNVHLQHRSGRCQGRRLECESGRHRPVSKRSDAYNPLIKHRDVVAVVGNGLSPRLQSSSNGRCFVSLLYA